MNLCTVLSENFIPQAINLIQSYMINSYAKKAYVYYFNCDPKKINILNDLFGDKVTVRQVANDCSHAHEPRVFYYKTHAISDCLLNSDEGMIYSDSSNCFVKKCDIKKDMRDGAIFLPYTHPILSNKYWTTKACFEKLEADGAMDKAQYWAGFQVYKNNLKNKDFVYEMHNMMKDEAVALPDTSVKKPDGSSSVCIEHRQDQSALSLLIHKHDRHQDFDRDINNRYGDWQTVQYFDKTYIHDFSQMVLSPRESKFGQFRYLK
jgi:hypothetical protein